MVSIEDTIYAPATIVAKSGLIVVRLSGKLSYDILKQLSPSAYKLTPRMATLFDLYHPVSKQIIDQAIVVYFKSPYSFTGEDIVEFHLHGSRAVMNMFVSAVSSLDYSDLRPAEPGEFARRAFLNGKMDLTQAEGLADLIEAETAFQHKQALNQMQGKSSALYDSWREDILCVLSSIEAYMDFPEDDLPDAIMLDVQEAVCALVKKITNHIQNYSINEMIKTGVKIAIIGFPNVGKSSLLNYLANRDVAIVSDIAGTTRDVIEVKLDISGYPVILYDTAGIRDNTEDYIEKEGIDRAILKAKESDMIIWLHDIDSGGHEQSRNHDFSDVQFLNEESDKVIHVYNKIDLIENVSRETLDDICISTKTEEGIDVLLNMIETKVKELFTKGDIEGAFFVIQERHKHCLRESLKALQEFDMYRSDDIVIAIEHLRSAANHIGSITGVISVEDVLDRVFANFCIGK